MAWPLFGQSIRVRGSGKKQKYLVGFFSFEYPGTVVPLGVPGSIHMLPHSQKTSRAHYPNPLPQGERG